MIRPYGGYVLVEVEKPADTTASGLIHLPDTARKPTHRGTVLGVGGGRVEEDGVFRTIDVKVGDRIAFDRMGVHDVPDMPTQAIVSSAYVLGVIEP